MPRIATKYDPDPEIEGMGTYSFDDGSFAFTSPDPDLDAQVAAAVAAQPPTPQGAPPAPSVPAPQVGGELQMHDTSAVDVNTDPRIQAAYEQAKAKGLDPASGIAGSASEQYQRAAQEAGAPKMQQQRDAGYQPAQRSGALPDDVAARQEEERASISNNLKLQTMLEEEREAEREREAALAERARLQAERDEAQRQQQEAQAKRARLLEERKVVADMEIDRGFATGNPLAQGLMVVAAALQGAIGQDGALRMMNAWVDRNVNAQLQQRNSTLDRLANELGSEEQAIAEAKSAAFEAAKGMVEAQARQMGAQARQDRIPLLMAKLDEQAMLNRHAAENASLGKTVETYDPGQPGGVVPGDSAAAAALLEKGERLDLDKRKQALAEKKASGGGGTAAADFSGIPEAEAYKTKELAAWAKRNGLSGKQVQDEWRKFSEKYQAGAPARQAVDDAMGLVEQYRSSGDVPGKGAFGNLPPNWLTSDEAVRVRQQIGIATALFTKEVSGATVTDQEAARLRTIAEGSGDFDDIIGGLEILQRARKATFKVLEADYPGMTRIRTRLEEFGSQGSAKDARANTARRRSKPGDEPEPKTEPVASVANRFTGM